MSAKETYDWKFSSVGGVTRVNIETGEDIAHLGELDQKLWTVLSCPVKGLEFDEHTLALMDFDNDGKIRINEVVATSKWLCSILKDPDELLKGSNSVNLSDLNIEKPEGKEIYTLATQVLSHLGKNADTISLADVTEYRNVFEEKCRTSHKTIDANTLSLPFGEKSDDAIATINTIKEKVSDFFMRCKLIQFHEDSSSVLDISTEKIGSISSLNLSECSQEIATYPLISPNKKAHLPLNEAVNPAWQSEFSKLKALVFDVYFADKDFITEKEWQSIVDKANNYLEQTKEKNVQDAEALKQEIADCAAAVAPIEKLLYLNRDFFKLLRNYVVFYDFYSRDNNNLAVFQAGTLFIDQRCCELCIKVSDISKHADMAKQSGMYLIYCVCTSRVKNEKMDIVAVLTDGDMDNLCEGKNAIFYDRDGLDWDAVVTKIIDNPISIRQAFWSPYKKFWKWCTEKLNKSASEKEAKSFDSITSKTDSAVNNITSASNNGTKEETKEKKEETVKTFDIAKFAGIFAAIGMAIGYITSALTGLTESIGSNPINLLAFILLIILVISGPSMLIAWMKLRKRNLGPILNANGWAINAKVLINVRFGATLTSLASYPKIVFDDPFVDKGTPKWKKWLITIVSLLVIIFAVLFFTNSLANYGLPFHKKAKTEQVEVAKPTNDTTTSDTTAISKKTEKSTSTKESTQKK